MYEELFVYTDDRKVYFILTVDDLGGLLIKWRLFRTKFVFEVKYKKGRTNTESDALSRLKSMRETISHHDSC